MEAEHVQQRDQHIVSKTSYENHVNMEVALNMLIVGVVKDCFLTEERNRYMEYWNDTDQKLV